MDFSVLKIVLWDTSKFTTVSKVHRNETFFRNNNFYYIDKLLILSFAL